MGEATRIESRGEPRPGSHSAVGGGSSTWDSSFVPKTPPCEFERFLAPAKAWHIFHNPRQGALVSLDTPLHSCRYRPLRRPELCFTTALTASLCKRKHPGAAAPHEYEWDTHESERGGLIQFLPRNAACAAVAFWSTSSSKINREVKSCHHVLEQPATFQGNSLGFNTALWLGAWFVFACVGRGVTTPAAAKAAASP